MDGEHRALERRRRDGAGLDLERGEGDLPGGPAAAGDQADLRGRAEPLRGRGHEGEQPPPRLPAGRHVGGHRRRARGRAAAARADREVRSGHFHRGAADVHGLRRAGGTARAARAAEGDLRRVRGAGLGRRLQRDRRDRRRRVPRRPARQPGPGPRPEQRHPRRDDGRGADGLHERHRGTRFRERRPFPAAEGAHAPGLGLRRQLACRVRHVLRGGDPPLRRHPPLPRASPRRPAPRRQFRIDLRHVPQRPAPGYRPAFHDRRAAARRVGWFSLPRREQRHLQRLPREHLQLPGRGRRGTLRALRRPAQTERRAGRRGRIPGRERDRRRLPRPRRRLLLHLRVHA